MTQIPYFCLKRILIITGSYLLAVLVADLVTILLFAPNKNGGLFLLFGFFYILTLASGPAFVFITLCEKLGHPNKWVYTIAGTGVALIAHVLWIIVEPNFAPKLQSWHFIAACTAGGAVGAFVFWKVAVASLYRHA